MPSRASEVRVRRVYDEPGDDGVRVLVDRVWPRGVSKQAARLDFWRKDLAPSTALRKWYGHDPDRFAEFRRRYEAELAEAGEALAELRALASQGRLTLLTATRELGLSNAQVLADLLNRPR